MLKMQRISSPKTSGKNLKPKPAKCVRKEVKTNVAYLSSNRSRKCVTKCDSNSKKSHSANTNKHQPNRQRKCVNATQLKSKSVKTGKRKMSKSSDNCSSLLSSRLNSSKTTPFTAVASEEDINIIMPTLTPEVPFEFDSDNDAVNTSSVFSASLDVNCADLAPPVLSPATDQECDSPVTNRKPKNKRKSKVHLYDNEEDFYTFTDTIFSTSSTSNNNNNIPREYETNENDNRPLAKKFRLFTKKQYKKSIKPVDTAIKSGIKSQKKTYKKLKDKMNHNNNNTNTSLNWSVDCNYTLTSESASNASQLTIPQPYVVYKNNSVTNQLLNGNSDSNNKLSNGASILADKYKHFKTVKQKLQKKQPKQQAIAESEAINELISEPLAVKPEAEIDEIEGIQFLSFETEDALSLYSKIDDTEKNRNNNNNSSNSDDEECNYSNPGSTKLKVKTFKSGKVIFPTKTKDITKIKGWREKLFASSDGQNKFIRKPYKKYKSSLHNKLKFDSKSSLEFNSSTDTMKSLTSKESKSAFVSDILDGYLKNKSDLKINYLSPDLAPPPDDSPIFSASVLKMPDNNTSDDHLMPPPNTPLSSQSSPSSNKRKGVFGRSKGLKNKLSFKPEYSDYSGDANLLDETSNFELFDTHLPIIRETHWPENIMGDEYLEQLYSDYIQLALNELQMLKRHQPPSFIMDDHYARFALSALQCNERIHFASSECVEEPTNDNVLDAVGLSPKLKDALPVEQTKITGRYRKDREADLAKIIAMGNRSKRQIRLPSRYHESSLLMGNQWVIPDYDQKGKTGKRRLQQEQRRLQELHQRQLEIEQRNNQSVISSEQTGYSNSDAAPQMSLLHTTKKKKCVDNQNMVKKKPKSSFHIPMNIPKLEYPLKIPQQRLKQLQMMRNRKLLLQSAKKSMKNSNKSDSNDSQTVNNNNKSFQSLFSMATQSSDDRRHVSLSAKAVASASQRAVVNDLFYQLFNTISPDKRDSFSKTGKINKLDVIREAKETIDKLTKRDQQLSYIKKLLLMWNHKLQLCAKVAQKDMKPEAYKVVNEVMNTYKSSMCYKVGEALEAKRKEFQQKRLLAGANCANCDKSKPATNAQPINIPISLGNASQFKTPKPLSPRLILPKLSPIYKTPSISTTSGSNVEVVHSNLLIQNSYPKLTPPPDLQHQRSSCESNAFNTREGSILKPPILTTRPTILKPFMLASSESVQSNKPFTGPVINVPNIPRLKSIAKLNSINASIPVTSLITSSLKPPLITSNTSTSLPNSLFARFKSPANNHSVTDSESLKSDPKNTVIGMNTIYPMVTTATATGTATPLSVASNCQDKPSTKYSPHHGFPGKSVIITSETPLGNDDLSKIVASIAANPDQFKKVPVRLSNGMAALAIPGPHPILEMPKLTNTTANSTSPAVTTMTSQFFSINQMIKRANSISSAGASDDTKNAIQKPNKVWVPSTTCASTVNISITGSGKPNIIQKGVVSPKMRSQSTDKTEDKVLIEDVLLESSSD